MDFIIYSPLTTPFFLKDLPLILCNYKNYFFDWKSISSMNTSN